MQGDRVPEGALLPGNSAWTQRGGIGGYEVAFSVKKRILNGSIFCMEYKGNMLSGARGGGAGCVWVI